LNRGCFEAVSMKNTSKTLGVKLNFIIYIENRIHGFLQTMKKNQKLKELMFLSIYWLEEEIPCNEIYFCSFSP
jgi:hypothetical protein